MHRLIIDADLAKHTINKHIHGHFSEHLGRCIYEGIWVGEDSPIPNTRGIRNDVVAALKQMGIPNLRWPGGCFADTYHWRDGIGLREERPTIINIHWGGVTENNHFGTHEFMDLCGQLGTEPVICGNVGSGTVREMAEWLEYLTMAGKSPMSDLRKTNGRDAPWDITYWGVGNENWGCGGNMRAEYYADVYRQFACYCRNFNGKPLKKVACGPSGGDYHWTEVMMRQAGGHMDALTLHHYSGWNCENRVATGFQEKDWWQLLRESNFLDDLITRHSAIMDQHDPAKRVALVVDEWGAWHNVEKGTNPGFLYQQNTIRDAVLAGHSLNILQNHAERVRMANIAQVINVLQAVILTEGEKMLLTPTFHVFEMYKVHQEALLLPSRVEGPAKTVDKDSVPLVSANASRDAQGRVHISLVNLDPSAEQVVEVTLHGIEAKTVTGRTLTAPAMDTHNTFDAPNVVVPVDGANATITGTGLSVRLPARSVTVLRCA